MRKITLVMIGMILLCGVFPAGAAVRTITLKDGSTVQGQILGIDQGRYVVQTAALGEIRVNEDDIVSIVGQNVPAPAGGDAAPATDEQLQQVQARLIADPQAMAGIQALMADPEVMRLISDPAFMAAAQRHDTAAIQADPRTAALMQNPKVKALIEQLSAGK